MRRLILFSTAALALSRARDGVRADSGVARRPMAATSSCRTGRRCRPGFLRIEDAAAATRRARSAGRGAARDRGGGNAPRPRRARGRPISPASRASPSISSDRIYVFNRGAKPVMVFDTDGKLVMCGRRSGDQRQEDQSVLAALGRGRLGRQRLHHRARRASHRQAQPEDGQVPAAARHDDGEGQRRDALRSAVRHRRAEERQHHRHRRLRQQPRRDVRQERQVHQAGRQGRRRSRRTRAPATANGCCRTSSPSMRRRTSTSSTARIIACRCSTRT